jgi:hypothetical protein
MVIFTVGERELIERAVDRFGDDRQRLVWRSWARAHPRVRRGPADQWDDGEGPIPPPVAEVVGSSLDQLFEVKAQEAKLSVLSEDDLADLSNDLTEIRSLARSLR